jgi:Na+-translocating ferredoxin:NAD+ oxidoreductase RnfA subunit
MEVADFFRLFAGNVLCEGASMNAPEQSIAVMLWWSTISGISVVNIIAWLLIARRENVDQDSESRRDRLWQVWLSAMFVFGCAFRSFLPRAEGQRICLVDTWWSNAFLGRLVATIAELSIVAQWTLFVRHWTRGLGSRVGYAVSWVLLPAIAFAEICSWYTALTTDFRGSVIEETTWAVTSSLMTLTLISLWWRRREVRRPFLGAAIILNTAYIMFMATVDVPMYASRVHADTVAGKTFLSVGEGLSDSLSRLVVTRRFEDWREEMPWMSLYFTAGVWISLSLISAPRLRTGLANGGST